MELSTARLKMKKTLRSGVRLILPFVVQRITSSQRREGTRAKSEAKRAKKGKAHVISYFHDVTDPYSHLAAQRIGSLMRTYDIELRPMLVNPPSEGAAPERAMLSDYALRDAAEIAPYHKLEFRTNGKMPDPVAFEEAGRLLSAAIAQSTFEKDAIRIGAALWAADRSAIEEIKAEFPMADEALFEKHLKQGDKELDRKRHYFGAVFAYGGESYWGVDRFHHLEERLLSLGLRNSFAAPKAIAPHITEDLGATMIMAPAVTIEFFASLRSPYTYIAMDRMYAMAQKYSLNLIMRPVMPMVMRGLPVPGVKRRYIMSDAKREAEQYDISFGKVCDPVGEPVERAMSLYPWAREQGLDKEFLLSFAKGAFADGIDGGTDRGLKKIVERAGLDWSVAKTLVGNEDWRDEARDNQELMFSLGLWGVPSFRVTGGRHEDEFAIWGQDRLWLIEREIQRRR
jgi:2-hydroxychromene-2-carboxylate isomerase